MKAFFDEEVFFGYFLFVQFLFFYFLLFVLIFDKIGVIRVLFSPDFLLEKGYPPLVFSGGPFSLFLFHLCLCHFL